jgi:hypothetical protein
MATKAKAKVPVKPAKKAPGRPSLYTPKLAQEICDRLATGEPLAQICRDSHMPERTAVYRWMDAQEGFTQRIAHARTLGYDALADDALTISNTPMMGVEVTIDDTGATTEKRVDMLGHRKLQIETRLKLLAKWDPKRYGDLTKVEHSGSVDIAASLTAARARSGLK